MPWLYGEWNVSSVAFIWKMMGSKVDLASEVLKCASFCITCMWSSYNIFDDMWCAIRGGASSFHFLVNFTLLTKYMAFSKAGVRARWCDCILKCKELLGWQGVCAACLERFSHWLMAYRFVMAIIIYGSQHLRLILLNCFEAFNNFENRSNFGGRFSVIQL